MKTLLLFPLILLLSTPAHGDELGGVILSLEKSIEIALMDSYDAKNLELTLVQAEQSVAAAKGRFKTKSELDLSIPDFGETVRGVQDNAGDLPIYGTYGGLEWRGDLGIRQPLPTNGSLGFVATLYRRGDSYYDPISEATSESRTYFNSFRLEFAQPLFLPNTLKLSLERAQLDLEEAQRTYTQVQLDVIYQVTNEFYTYLRAQRSVEIARETLEQQKSSATLAKQKYEAGLIPEVEALQMEVDLAQSQNELLATEGRLARAADSFRMAIGIPMDQGVGVVASPQVRFYEVDPQQALEHALAHRAEVQNAEANLRRAEITVKETDALWQVSGELRAYYDLVGISSPTLGENASWGDRIDSAWKDLGRRPGNRGVSFLLNVPIWDSGVNKAEVASARAVLHRRDLDQEQSRRQVIQSVNAALTRMDEARARLEALERSRELARRSYDISQERFANGDITTQELALDRDRWTQAELAWLDAYIQYELAGADLKRRTLYDFENGEDLASLPSGDQG